MKLFFTAAHAQHGTFSVVENNLQVLLLGREWKREFTYRESEKLKASFHTASQHQCLKIGWVVTANQSFICFTNDRMAELGRWGV